MADVRRFVRDNLVFVAAFALPGAVAVLFLLATAIPKWTVPLPQHDLVLRIENYAQPPTAVIVEIAARDGRLEAIVRPVPKPADPAVGVLPYGRRSALLLFDHDAMQIREIPLDLPKSVPEGETRTVVIEALAGRRVLSDQTAPDGYKVASLNTGSSGGGIVGELFGMNRRYRRGVALAKDGRTIELELPSPHRDSYEAITTIGWIADDSRR